MIIDRDNPVSIKYSEISKQSYQPLIEDGTIEIIDFPAVNLKTLDQYQSKYNFRPSLVIGQVGKEHHPTEVAGMCSHFELLKKQSETSERFFILEHDSYLLEPNQFRQYINLIQDESLCYANIGLFFSCYTVSQHFAEWAYNILTTHPLFPVNCGPYLNMERLFKTYLGRNLEPKQDYTFLIPNNSFKYLHLGRYKFEIEKIDQIQNYDFPNPTTQVVSEMLNVTQYHDGFSSRLIENPHMRHPWFKRID